MKKAKPKYVPADRLKPWKRGAPEANRRQFKPVKPPTIKAGPYTGRFAFIGGKWVRIQCSP